jgi:prepilin-type N-terminal cleavage/methylation domain-containing protein
METHAITPKRVERLMQPHFSPAARSRASGFSLIELAICIMVMGVIVIASVRLLDRVEDAKVKSAAQTARRINEIASTIYETTGHWPAEVDTGIIPTEMIPYLSNPIFENATPLGGEWDWNGPNNPVSTSVGIAIRFKSESEPNFSRLSQVDQLIDDGLLGTGECRWIQGYGHYYMMEIMMGEEAPPRRKLERVTLDDINWLD